ncbi:thioredoxin-disulfide reductase [Thermoclostridium caenicola]|uniref:Thioredoxin reductase n=1 Tax=Thermoclostridium caenicola TaxID=659425 RepID=A0A1M6B543_9FIRM|nr:thioredoxin-disulfide reductase [Thermoclostridium caenicola]SHI43780.1 thioredoxin reductase (NADPH) [Thermoclostridium caenicola]HOL84350.1 thioredoxin-disulfide reductase [Thermoclostridium caenicola]
MMNILSVDSKHFEQQVLKSTCPVVVYFRSDDCLPCITFDGIFERVAPSRESIRFVKIFTPENRQLAEQYGIKSFPTLLFFSDGKEVCRRLTGYISYQEFREAVDMLDARICPPDDRAVVHCDVLIIGAGPAGLTAAIYAARSKLFTVVLESGVPGGQVITTYQVENYPGTSGAISGFDLMENMIRQAREFGARIDDMQEIEEVRLEGNEKHVRTKACDYYAKAVIIATGAEPKKLPVAQESVFRGRGIHYCASCDGAFYQNAELAVVGGGVAAFEEAVFLTRFARKVTILIRSDTPRAPSSYVEDALKNPRIAIRFNTVITKVLGDDFVHGAVLENTKTGETSEMKLDGIFVYIGSQPNTQLFRPWLNLSDRGYIITGEDMATNIPGVFAAGDVREKEVRQIATAVGDGTIAGIMAEKYIHASKEAQ